jgi:hypothetical protein
MGSAGGQMGTRVEREAARRAWLSTNNPMMAPGIMT